MNQLEDADTLRLRCPYRVERSRECRTDPKDKEIFFSQQLQRFVALVARNTEARRLLLH